MSLVRPYTLGAGAGPSAVMTPAQTIQLLQHGAQRLDPAKQQELQQAIAQLSTPDWQARLAATPDVANKTQKGIDLMTLLVSFGLPLTNPTLAQLYGYLQSARTTGGYDPRGVMQAAPAFGQGGITAHNTTGARLRYGQQTMTAQRPF